MSSDLPEYSPTRTAWVVVLLLFPVALLNYLDRQMIASMRTSVVRDVEISVPQVGANSKGDTNAEAATGVASSERGSKQELDAKHSPKNGIDSQWGHMLGQFKWVYALFSPIGGFIADRFSRKFTVCFSLIVWSAITFATGMVTTFEGLLWTRTLMGISEAFYIPAALALIADFHLGSTRSKAVGVHQMGIYCGVILGGFSGFAADYESIGWRFAFKFVGILGITYAVPLLYFLQDAPKVNSLVENESGQRRTSLSAAGALATNASFVLLVLYFTLPALAGWVIRDWMPALLKDAFPDLSQGRAGAISIVWQVVAILAAILGGVWADKWMASSRRGRIYVSAIGMGLIIPSLILVGVATSEGGTISLAIVALILFGLGWGFFDCNNMPILCQIVRPQLRATGYGFMNLVSIFCGGLADKKFGVLKEQKVHSLSIFGLFATFCLISIILVLLIRPKPDLDAENVQAA